MAVVLVGVHRAAEDEHGAVVVERPRERRVPGQAPLLQPVAGPGDDLAEDPGTNRVAVDHREHVHRAEGTASPPLAGMPAASSSRRSCAAFAVAWAIRRTAEVGSSTVELLLKNAYTSSASPASSRSGSTHSA